MFFTTIAASLSGLIIGPILHNYNTSISTAVISVILITIFNIFKKNKNYIIGNKIIVAITGFGLFPSIFFTTFGINSAFPLYMLLIPAAYGVIARRLRSTILPACNLLLYLTILWYSFSTKQLTEIRIIPYLIGFAVSFSLIYAITSFLSISTRHMTAKLKKASTMDELTQVYNRRNFDLNFTSYNYQIGAMFDIDDFKKVNDTLGHQTGDEILFNFAQILLRYASDEFRVYRWGGEEFIVLSKLDLETTTRTLMRMYDTIRKELKTPDGNQITVSCGLARTKKSNLIQEVDSNLYFAKHTGKNKLVYKNQAIY